MDQQRQQPHQAGNPSSPGDGQPHHIKQDQAAALAHYNNGLGLIDPSNLSFDTSSYQSTDLSNAPPSFNLTQDIGQNQQHIQNNSYMGDPQGGFTESLLSTYNNDFMQFPSTADGQFNNNGASSPFGSENYGNGTQDSSMGNQHGMTMQHLSPDGQQPGSAQHSPAFSQNQFSPPTRGSHSRHTSLTPQDAYLLGPGQVGVDWTQTMGMQGPHFRQHQRTPSASEFSDVSSVGGYSSVAPSPQIVGVEAFDNVRQQNSPENEQLLAELQAGIPNISISDQGTHSRSPSQHSHHTLGRTPIHSPAISPRIMPAQMPDVNPHQQYMLQGPNNSFGPPASYGSMQQMGEQFPQLQSSPDPQQTQFQLQAPPQIQVDSTYAPSSSMQTIQTNGRPLDADSLTPPARGRPQQRQRAVSDPFNAGGAQLGHRRSPSGSSVSGHLSPNDMPGSTPHSHAGGRPSGSGAGSLSPSPNRGRRHSSVTASRSNALALRLVDPEGAHSGETGPGGKRVQKHKATFACPMCDKMFTRAYNLRSHKRTHTDERPFKCDHCSKAFARQHDRKRHQELHTGLKKFPCKGNLKNGQTWGCGRKFARADALGRHFRSENGRTCIKPLLDEEHQEAARLWHERQMVAAGQQGMNMGMGGGMQQQQQPMMDMMMPPQGGMLNINPNGFNQQQQPPSMNPTNAFVLPQAIYDQFPQLRGMQFDLSDVGDEPGGNSAFEASDLDEGDDGGYLSGPGLGEGAENFQGAGYSSDFGGA